MIMSFPRVFLSSKQFQLAVSSKQFPLAVSSSGEQCGYSRSDRVRETGKVEVSHLDGRHDDSSACLCARKPNRTSERLEIIQHEQRRLVEAEVLERLRELPVLDQERAVARQPCVKNRARVHLAQIPEP